MSSTQINAIEYYTAGYVKEVKLFTDILKCQRLLANKKPTTGEEKTPSQLFSIGTSTSRPTNNTQFLNDLMWHLLCEKQKISEDRSPFELNETEKNDSFYRTEFVDKWKKSFPELESKDDAAVEKKWRERNSASIADLFSLEGQYAEELSVIFQQDMIHFGKHELALAQSLVKEKLSSVDMIDLAPTICLFSKYSAERWFPVWDSVFQLFDDSNPKLTQETRTNFYRFLSNFILQIVPASPVSPPVQPTLPVSYSLDDVSVAAIEAVKKSVISEGFAGESIMELLAKSGLIKKCFADALSWMCVSPGCEQALFHVFSKYSVKILSWMFSKEREWGWYEIGMKLAVFARSLQSADGAINKVEVFDF